MARCYTATVRLSNAFNALLDFCFPGVCAACKMACDGRTPLCVNCLALLHAVATSPACRLCAAPLAIEGSPCPYCRQKGLKPFQRVVALGHFEAPVREMIHAIKYHRDWPLAEYLADYLLEQERVKELLTGAEVLIPVPLYPLRQLSRGFNQASVIATRLKKRSGLALAEVLIRVRDTETQTHFHSRAKRIKNMKGAFALGRAKHIRGKHVILLDDVMTSGATLRAAVRALKEGEPASVSALVLAVADPRGRSFERV